MTKPTEAFIASYQPLSLIKPDSYTHNFSVVSIGFDDAEAWCDDKEVELITPEILMEVSDRMKEDLNERFYYEIRQSFDDCLDAALTERKLK